MNTFIRQASDSNKTDRQTVHVHTLVHARAHSALRVHDRTRNMSDGRIAESLNSEHI